MSSRCVGRWLTFAGAVVAEQNEARIADAVVASVSVAASAGSVAAGVCSPCTLVNVYKILKHTCIHVC